MSGGMFRIVRLPRPTARHEKFHDEYLAWLGGKGRAAETRGVAFLAVIPIRKVKEVRAVVRLARWVSPDCSRLFVSADACILSLRRRLLSHPFGSCTGRALFSFLVASSPRADSRRVCLESCVKNGFVQYFAAASASAACAPVCIPMKLPSACILNISASCEQPSQPSIVGECLVDARQVAPLTRIPVI